MMLAHPLQRGRLNGEHAVLPSTAWRRFGAQSRMPQIAESDPAGTDRQPADDAFFADCVPS